MATIKTAAARVPKGVKVVLRGARAGSGQFVPFPQVSEEGGVVGFGGVYLDEIDVLFEAAAAEVFGEEAYGFGVVLAYLRGLNADLFSGLHVSKDHRDIGKAELALRLALQDMEDEHFVAFMPEVAE